MIKKPFSGTAGIGRRRNPRVLQGGFLLAALVWVCFWPAPAQGQTPLSVPGITEPIKDVTLSLTVGGTISKISFREGVHVKKGRTLIVLDNKLEELEVKRRKLLWESKAEVQSAMARVATLKSQFESTRELFESTGSVSKDELDRLELEYKLAVAEQERLEIAEERERVEYDIAVETLRKKTLKAPIDGVIIKLFLEEGESCEGLQPLVRLVDPGKCLMVCNAEEWLGRTIKKGQKVDLKIRIGSEFLMREGRVIFVSPVADAASGLLEVKAEFENQDGLVRPGVSGFMLFKAP